MRIGGLGSRAALQQKPTKSCDRCGLRYPEDEESCPHCKDIHDSELAGFKEHIQTRHEAGVRLGRMFFLIAVFIGALLLLSL